MFSFKGIDNATYYRLSDEDPRYYMDFTGTGNTLDPTNPSVLRLIMDSLRYFVSECHVDGFRFDLAPALARTFYEVDRLSSFFDAMHQDPVLSRVKLIAEPWDVGPGGYQVGNFPVLWAEWNAAFRDDIRDFWRGEATLAAFAQRFAGSSDLYADGRRPHASINFVTAHDGFTLNDLVSYETKHNEANLEDNQDGNDANRSWNCGAEGATDDPEILALRGRQVRNLLASLLLSQGVPMLLGGDEIGRTQHGNNNGWCQDNELSWLDWEAADDDLQTFAASLIALRNREPVFRRREFLTGENSDTGVADVTWLRPDARPMADEDWQRDETRAIAILLDGHAVPVTAAGGDTVRGDSFLMLVNGGHEPVDFHLPEAEEGHCWRLELQTGDPHDFSDEIVAGGRVEPRTTIVLRESRDD
jgi:glycogen operon protein